MHFAFMPCAKTVVAVPLSLSLAIKGPNLRLVRIAVCRDFAYPLPTFGDAVAFVADIKIALHALPDAMPLGAVVPRKRGHPPTFIWMTMFALVHGAWHGAWCWELLTPFLRQAGHSVVAPELPSDHGSADFDAYADVMCGALRGCDDDVVVVGHSLGGPTATLVAARRPPRHLVYLCAVVPEVGLSLVDQGLEQITAEFANGWVKGLSKPDAQGRTV